MSFVNKSVSIVDNTTGFDTQGLICILWSSGCWNFLMVGWHMGHEVFLL